MFQVTDAGIQIRKLKLLSKCVILCARINDARQHANNFLCEYVYKRNNLNIQSCNKKIIIYLIKYSSYLI